MRRLLACALLGLTGCGACEPDRSLPEASTSTSASASAAPAGPPVLPTHTPRALGTKLACRVIALDGEAHIEGPAAPDAGSAPLLLQGLAPTEAWVSLGRASRFVARDPRTTRETTFRGPGRARACVDFSEESWLASGIFESSAGAGEAPGAEEWVVTPVAVVRYAAAQLTVEALHGAANVTIRSGNAFAWSVDQAADAGVMDGGAMEEGWQRLSPGQAHLGPSREEVVAATLNRCTTLAESARALATLVMTPGVAGSDAGVITRQVTTRRLARAACAVATLRVSALPASDAAPLLRPLADANSAWSGLPSPAAP